jgi:hypothetical protein
LNLGDGCIFIWRLPKEISEQIRDKLRLLKPKFLHVSGITNDENIKENMTLSNIQTLRAPNIDEIFQNIDGTKNQEVERNSFSKRM